MSSENGVCKFHAMVDEQISSLKTSQAASSDDIRELFRTRPSWQYYALLVLIIIALAGFQWTNIDKLSGSIRAIEKTSAVQKAKTEAILEAVKEIKGKMK